MGTPTKVNKYAFNSFAGNVLAPSDFKDTALNSGLNRKKIFASEGTDWGEHVTAKMFGFKCYEPFIESILKFKNIKFCLEDGTPLTYTKTDDGYYIVKGLEMDTEYTFKVTYTDAQGVNKSCEFDIKTKIPSFEISSTSTQSTITVEKIDAKSDDTCTPEHAGLSPL